MHAVYYLHDNPPPPPLSRRLEREEVAVGLARTTLNFFCLIHEDQSFFSVLRHHKCLS